MPAFDKLNFRSALGRFATGVTIITARGSDGRPVGVTANSFNSVSLDPPLVLWSLKTTSNSLAAFETADGFAIHVLGLEQQALSNRFAASATDKFEGLKVRGVGIPLLDDCAARFVCRKVQRHEVGDHILFIGEVVDFEARDGAPLLYLAGSYSEARRREAAALSYDLETARLGEGAILNLFADAYRRITARITSGVGSLGLERPVPAALIALAGGATSLADVEEALGRRGHEFGPALQAAMTDDGLITIEGTNIALLSRGQEVYARLLASLKQVEEDLVSEFTAGELSDARHFLAQIGREEAEVLP